MSPPSNAGSKSCMSTPSNASETKPARRAGDQRPLDPPEGGLARWPQITPAVDCPPPPRPPQGHVPLRSPAGLQTPCSASGVCTRPGVGTRAGVCISRWGAPGGPALWSRRPGRQGGRGWPRGSARSNPASAHLAGESAPAARASKLPSRGEAAGAADRGTAGGRAEPLPHGRPVGVGAPGPGRGEGRAAGARRGARGGTACGGGARGGAPSGRPRGLTVNESEGLQEHDPGEPEGARAEAGRAAHGVAPRRRRGLRARGRGLPPPQGILGRRHRRALRTHARGTPRADRSAPAERPRPQLEVHVRRGQPRARSGALLLRGSGASRLKDWRRRCGSRVDRVAPSLTRSLNKPRLQRSPVHAPTQELALLDSHSREGGRH